MGADYGVVWSIVALALVLAILIVGCWRERR